MLLPRCVLLLLITTCSQFCHVVDGLGTMLVQGRADTIRALRDMVRKSSWAALDEKTSKWNTDQIRTREIIGIDPIFRRMPRVRRHISNVLVESSQCDHVDLVDCSDFETDEMTCMLTATGMTCCICTGVLRAAKRTLF